MGNSIHRAGSGGRGKAALAPRFARGAFSIGAVILATACASPPPPEPDVLPSPPLEDIAIYHRAESERAERLEIEVKRLRADLRQAEEALVNVESGLRGNHNRANAVSAMAEVRISTNKAAERAPWRAAEIEEARVKLREAERQVQQGNAGAALFFVYRARRIAELALLEADAVNGQNHTRFIGDRTVNLREGPTTRHRVVDVLQPKTPVFLEREEKQWVLVRVISGPAGWVHKDLLQQSSR